MSGAPLLRAAGLRQKTSAKGNVYLVGRLGGVKVQPGAANSGNRAGGDIAAERCSIDNRATRKPQARRCPRPTRRALRTAMRWLAPARRT
jgi:hypothetical protein